MFYQIERCAGLMLAIVTTGCADSPDNDPRYTDLSHLLPVWIVEDDRNVILLERTDLDRDRGIQQILAIPVYRDYRYAGATNPIAIAHPFLYHPGDNLEARLRALGQRDKLARLIIWPRGYFPRGIGGNYIWSPLVNGKRMIVKELQRCKGSEAAAIDAAMAELLQESDFLVGHSPPRPPIPDTAEPIEVEFRYDARQVVRSVGYDSRYFRIGYTHATYLLWGYDVGTKIVNRLSAEEKRMVADFAAAGAPANTPTTGAKLVDGTYAGEGWSVVFKQGKCYCVDDRSKERAETQYLVKDDKVYIAPIVPKGKQMTRNAWPVYTIKGDSLESSHVEDMDTGEVFYKDQQPVVVLVRVQDAEGK